MSVSIVIGSWGSYNACNERALGSKWIDLTDYSDWEEIKETLIEQGFELNGIDEELFIQDIEGLPSNCTNWDYVNPKTLFEILNEADVLSNDTAYETMLAFIEVRSFDEFEDLVMRKGCNWNDCITLYKDYDWEDYGRQLFDSFEYRIDDVIENFIDYEAYGRYMGDNVEEYSNGLIEIYQ